MGALVTIQDIILARATRNIMNLAYRSVQDRPGDVYLGFA
jgi:hypothetical protein